MIEIDDAGTGSPLLGEVYVARRVETNESAFLYVPIENMNRKDRNELLLKLLGDLKADINETIYLCRGPIFNHFHMILTNKGYEVKRVEIGQKTNDLAENYFLDKLYEIGFPKSINAKNRNYGEFSHYLNIWYQTLYKGKEDVRKPSTKGKVRTSHYMFNPVRKFPLLVEKLFNNDI